ncbi:MAG: hypothetical protein QG673_111 [Pseudomonadota bacterium]|nr:hypothetical protein [Pseudomonadota bacterium]
MNNVKNDWGRGVGWCRSILITVFIALLGFITVSCGSGANSSESGGNAVANANTDSALISNKYNQPATYGNDAANQWAYMSGYKLVDQYGLYVGQGTVGGLPGTRTSAVAQADNSGNI